MAGEDEVVRSSTAARLLRVNSRTTINNWIKEGLLRSTTTVGGQNRIPRASIDELNAILSIKEPAERAMALEDLRERNRRQAPGSEPGK